MCNGVDISKDDNLEPISDTFLAGKKRKTLRVFNEELLSLPVKQFIAECVQQCIVGIPSQSLTQLIVHFINLLHSSLGKELREGKKGSMTVEELCKKVQSDRNYLFTSHFHSFQRFLIDKNCFVYFYCIAR